jgi:hypothetical protein
MPDTPTTIVGWPATARLSSAEEQAILRIVDKSRAEQLARQESFLRHEQARHPGDIGERPEQAANAVNRR